MPHTSRRTPFRFTVPALLLSVGLSLPAAPANTAPAQSADRFDLPPTDEGLPGAGPLRRYDWFQRLWRERRSAWAESVEQDRGAVVFLGDSITQGWGGGLGAAFPGTRVANRGISGDTTRGVLIRLDEDVLALDPAGVVLLIGTNDLDEGASPETISGNLDLMLGWLRSHDPELPVVLCLVLPSSATMDRPAEQIRALNGLYREVAKRHSGVVVLDTWTLFADSSGDAKAVEFPDLLHPNESGYAKWAAALRPVLETLGLSPVEPDPWRPEPGFESLFSGRDLTGWGYRLTSEADVESARRWREGDPNAPPWPVVTEAVSFDGLEASPDGRYVARNGRLIVTIPPEQRKIQKLWTTREFDGDFVLRLEFRATPNADSGIFLKEPQLQCRDYALAGPWKDLERYRPQDWNEIEVTVRAGEATATCNGELLEAGIAVPARGPIGLEGDRGQMEYRRIRIRVGGAR